MEKQVSKRIAFLMIAVSLGLTGCSGLLKKQKEIEARGTVEGGGYDWAIHDDYEGGNTIRTYGYPRKSDGRKASMKLCEKYGKTTEYSDKQKYLGAMQYEFNCVNK